jgi:hypothetical protein
MPAAAVVPTLRGKEGGTMESYAQILASLDLGTGKVGGAIYDYAIVMAAVGTLVMALLETVKEIFRLRWAFNRWQVRRWVARDDGALRELHELASGSINSTAGLYDQPIDKMMAQVQAAANLTLEYPQLYPAAYLFLTDLSGVRTHPAWKHDWQRNEDAAAYLEFARTGEMKQWETMDSARKLEISQMKARLHNLITRKLDMFQNRAQQAWALCNQVVSVLAAGVLVMMILQSNGVGPVRSLVWGLFGGLLAPVAKDLVSGLKSFARGS